MTVFTVLPRTCWTRQRAKSASGPAVVGCAETGETEGFCELAAKCRLAAAIEMYHEEHCRALLQYVEAVQVFEKGEVKVWECSNCVHIVDGTKAPELCPICVHPF